MEYMYYVTKHTLLAPAAGDKTIVTRDEPWCIFADEQNAKKFCDPVQNHPRPLKISFTYEKLPIGDQWV